MSLIICNNNNNNNNNNINRTRTNVNLMPQFNGRPFSGFKKNSDRFLPIVRVTEIT